MLKVSGMQPTQRIVSGDSIKVAAASSDCMCWCRVTEITAQQIHAVVDLILPHSPWNIGEHIVVGKENVLEISSKDASERLRSLISEWPHEHMLRYLFDAGCAKQ